MTKQLYDLEYFGKILIIRFEISHVLDLDSFHIGGGGGRRCRSEKKEIKENSYLF